MMRICRICGIDNTEVPFVTNANMCRQCYNELQRKKYLEKLGYNPEEIKTCSKCGFIGKASKFHIGQDVCKKCNIDKVCRVCGKVGDKDLFVSDERICLVCENARKAKYRKENPEKTKESRKKYYYNNLEKEKIKNKKFIENNPDYQKQWRQTPIGQVYSKKRNAIRRKLGNDPINKWFRGSELHHLRYSKTIQEQDNYITMYVPRKLHRSIHHNGITGRNMKQINLACLVWYFNTTPEKEQNPEAEKLYNNYLTLPEPVWV